ncbi:hypothetical protein ACOMHN_009462 [Nucella lapillus]
MGPVQHSGTTDCGLFQKQTTLTTAQYLKTFSCADFQACALHCVDTSGCRRFFFSSTAKTCSVYEENSSMTTSLPSCTDENYCYSSVC